MLVGLSQEIAQAMHRRTNLLGSGVVLHDGAGRVLLQHRTADAPVSPSLWGVFGGKSVGRESAAQTAARELREELRLAVSPSDLEPLCVLDQELHGTTGDVHYFAARLRVPVESLELCEGDDMGLFTQAEVERLDLTPGAPTVLGRFFSTH